MSRPAADFRTGNESDNDPGMRTGAVTMARRTKCSAWAALILAPLVLMACGEDPTEQTLAANSPSEPAAEADTGAGAGATDEADEAASGTQGGSTSPGAVPDGGGTSLTPPASGGSGPATCAPGGSANVTIAQVRYQPTSLQVAPCTEITVTNDDSQDHTVSYNSGSSPTASINLLEPGDVKTLVIEQAGNYEYICSFHPTMVLTVTAQ
jgi:plastocyanin